MNNNETVRYFDLHTNGVGYLNRIRDVEPTDGAPFLAVTVAAIHGKSSEVDHTYFECTVYGEQAQSIVRELKSAVDADKKVFVGFTLSNLKASAFTFQQGDKKGQSGVNLNARLIRIAWAKVDGQKVSFDQRHVA